MKLKCKKAGQSVVDSTGQPLACSACNGEITVVGGRIALSPIGGMLSLPRIPLANFNCPATISNPRESELVEVVEE